MQVILRPEVHTKLSLLAELLQSELQIDPGRDDIASKIQKRLQRVKQIACLTKPQRGASRQPSASASNRCTPHPESPANQKGRNAPRFSTSTSAHTTVPTYSEPQHIQSGRSPANEISTIPQTFTFYHPQPQQHFSGRHGHSKPHCGNLKPSWDSSFAAEQEDGYVPNVRNRKLLHEHSLSTLQRRQSQRMHALTAAASLGRRHSASHSTPSLQPAAPHTTAGSHAAFQRVLQRREQRAQRRRTVVAAPSSHTSPQAQQPPRQHHTARSTGAVHKATVTSAIHPAAGRKAEPRARTRFASIPAAASSDVCEASKNSLKLEGPGSAPAPASGRQASDRGKCAAAATSGNASRGGSSCTSAAKLYPDERQSGGMHYDASRRCPLQLHGITFIAQLCAPFILVMFVSLRSIENVQCARHERVYFHPARSSARPFCPPGGVKRPCSASFDSSQEGRQVCTQVTVHALVEVVQAIHARRHHVNHCGTLRHNRTSEWAGTTVGCVVDDNTLWVGGLCDCLLLLTCVDLCLIVGS